MRQFRLYDLKPFQGLLQEKSDTLRVAYIEAVDPDNGTVDIKWMDHPASRKGIQLNNGDSGIISFPVPGMVVLIAMRADTPEIIKYLPIGWAKDVAAGNKDSLVPGELLLNSYAAESYTESGPPVTPRLTGTQIKMDTNGRIVLSTASGDSWIMDPNDNVIAADSMNNQVSTEAGILDFGIIKDDAGNIITKDNISPTLGGKPLNEFRLRVIETSDLDPTTDAEIETPFVEMTLGTCMNSDRSEPLQTTSDDAVAGKEIVISLKTKSSINFKFIVDKDGNVTMSVADGKKLKIRCDDIELGGSGQEQPVVLKSFITDYYSGHKHIGNSGFPTSEPIVIPPTSPASPDSTNVVSKSVIGE